MKVTKKNDSTALSASLVKPIDLSVFRGAGSVSEEDKKKVREYAKIVYKSKQIEEEYRKINEMLRFIDADWCTKYLWQNAKGEVFPIFDIGDDYLKNIVKWCVDNRHTIPTSIKKEYVIRFGIDSFVSDNKSKNEDLAYKTEEDFSF
jgi:hypothetical protein